MKKLFWFTMLLVACVTAKHTYWYCCDDGPNSGGAWMDSAGNSGSIGVALHDGGSLTFDVVDAGAAFEPVITLSDTGNVTFAPTYTTVITFGKNDIAIDEKGHFSVHGKVVEDVDARKLFKAMERWFRNPRNKVIYIDNGGVF